MRNLSEAVQALLEENFDGLLIEGEAAVSLQQATNLRQHFPSLRIACLLQSARRPEVASTATEQNIELLPIAWSDRGLRATLTRFIRSLDSHAGTAAEGIDPRHSLIGNSTAEIPQMSCLSRRSGRFTFESGRGNSEIYLQQGSVRMQYSVQWKVKRLWPKFSGWFYFDGVQFLLELDPALLRDHAIGGAFIR